MGTVFAMWKLAVIVHLVVGPTVMGALVVAALLVPDFANGRGILTAAVVGAVLSFPLSVYVARRMLAGETKV